MYEQAAMIEAEIKSAIIEAITDVQLMNTKKMIIDATKMNLRSLINCFITIFPVFDGSIITINPSNVNKLCSHFSFNCRMMSII